jgi:long-chain acyl-CoA synthetase
MTAPTTLLEYFVNNSQVHAEQPAFVIRRRIKKEQLFYRDIPILMAQFHAFFEKNKLPPQTPILFWGPNCPEYSLSLIACFSLSRIAVPIDVRTSTTTAKKIVTQTKPKAAIISRFMKCDFLPKSTKVFYFEDLLAELSLLPQLNPQALLKKYQSTKKEAIAEIVFTSGTTGTPKGVVLTQANLLASTQLLRPGLPNLFHARILSLLPLSHIYEQNTNLLLPFQYGATVFYLVRLNSHRIIEGFKEYQPTHQTFVPQMLRLLWTKIEQRAIAQGKFTSLKRALALAEYCPPAVRRILFKTIHQQFGGNLQMIISGGAPLDPQLARNWQRLGFTLLQGYGATETTGVICFTRESNNVLGTVGQPLTGITLKLSAEKEIEVSGPLVSPGYYQQPAQTKAKFTDGCYKTGDVGIFDQLGNLKITGRDAFKIVLENGEKVYAEDIESVILAESQVQDVCVLGKKNNDSITVHAVLLLKDHATKQPVDIIESVNKKLESKQQILSWEVWPESDLPRTATLKVDRKKMAALINEGASAEVTETTTFTSKKDIIDIISEVSGVPRAEIKDDQLLGLDLKIDSLSRLEIVALGEEYLGVLIDESKITQHTKVSDLKHLTTQAETLEPGNFTLWHLTPWGRWIREKIVRYLFMPLYSQVIKVEYPQAQIPVIPPGTVIIFNHPGIADSGVIIKTLLNQNTFTYFANARPDSWHPKTLETWCNEIVAATIPLYLSGHRLQKTLQIDSDYLSQGYNLLFAPQGTQQRQDEEDPFRSGIGYMLRELDVPVVIIKIKGYRELWPAQPEYERYPSLRARLPKRRGPVQLYISEPIHPDWRAFSPSEIAQQLEEKYKKLG